MVRKLHVVVVILSNVNLIWCLSYDQIKFWIERQTNPLFHYPSRTVIIKRRHNKIYS